MFKRKKENDEERRKRIRKLCKNVDCGIFNPPMDAQVALNELCRYLLGEDWYVNDPVNIEQINTQIVYEIECKYKDVNNKRRK